MGTVVALSLVLAVTAISAVNRAAAAPTPSHLTPFTTETGKVYMSVDAFGTNNPSGGPIKVHKNDASTTVVAAYLLAASTGGSSYTPVNGDVTLNGTAVTWDPSKTIPSAMASWPSVNVLADVTSIVKPVIASASPGDVSFTVAEGANVTANIDGEILAVILNDPALPTDNTVGFLYGALAPTGDTFAIGLANPINTSDPHLGLTMSLGDSFGYQPSGQYSQIDVNGHRLTTSAGGQDDSNCKYDDPGNFPACGNGTLITAGGVGDSTANPPDPNATDETCTNPSAPRCDDELYNLLPFVKNGDTNISVATNNPSNNDNIFFAGFDLNSTAAVIGQGIVLSPVSATNPVGTNHTLTAHVQDATGAPITNTPVTFTVTAGPNVGKTGTSNTDSHGNATFTYSSSVIGTDTIEATFKDSTGATVTSNSVTKTWVNGGAPPTCALSSVVTGPPKGIKITVQDTGSGLASVSVTTHNNATVSVPSFTSGTKTAVVVTATKTNQALASQVALQVKNVNGATTNCDPLLATLHNGSTASATLDAAEHYLFVTNGSPGLSAVTVSANGHAIVVSLDGGERRLVDISSALHSGANNVSVAGGSGGGSADVLVWDGGGTP